MHYLDRFTPPPTVAPMIRFGKQYFSHPELLAATGLLASLAGGPGLYVVMVYDPHWRPLPYRPIYFGESETIWRRATPSHENYGSWKREAGTAALYRAFHYMTGTNRFQRQAAESELISHYATPCNERLSSLSYASLLGRR